MRATGLTQSFARIISTPALGGLILFLLSAYAFWPHAASLSLRTAVPTPCYPNAGEREPLLFLFGVLLRAEDASRRELLRASYDRWKPYLDPRDEAHFVFVICRPTSLELQKMLDLEQAQHHDLLFVDGEENMNTGKTWEFFKVGAVPTPLFSEPRAEHSLEGVQSWL
jgi:hypothetical protein